MTERRMIMVGFHTTRYTTLLATYLSAFMTMFFAVCFYLKNWRCSFKQIILKLIMLPLLPVNIAITLSMFALYWLSYIFNLIPVVRDILLFLVVFVYGGLTSFLFMLMNSYNFHQFSFESEMFGSEHVY